MHLDSVEMARMIADALRHRPEQLGLENSMDSNGWVRLEDLQQGFMRYTPYDVSFEEVVDSVTSQNRSRFEVSDDYRIRALENHSTDQVKYQVVEPEVDRLYRIESLRHMKRLESEGLVATRRKYLEVFESPKNAREDARKRRIKHGVLLAIDCHSAYHDGTLFFSRNGKTYVENVSPAHFVLSPPNTES